MFETIFKEYIEVAYKYIWESPAIFPWMVALLLGSGIYVTFLLKWPNIRRFKHAINILRGVYDDPNDAGDIKHYQALTTALSATVGIGNIAGVATAIHYGGPGTIFWLWVSGLFGMTLKYCECTLSLKYRTFDEKGFVSGGPMYYIDRGLGHRWKWMAMVFAFLAIISSFGSGNMNQSNTVAVSAMADFNAPDWIVGLILAALVSMVILGGIKRIGSVTAYLMPAMGILYALGAFYILIRDIPQLPGLFATIITEAWKPKAAFGGTVAGVWNLTLLWGIKRALFSNEAGQGSAPIAHAAAKTDEPVREGTLALLGPFIDTLVICTMTGLVVILSGVWDQKKMDLRALDTNKIAVYADPGYAVTDRSLHDSDPGSPVRFSGRTEVVDGRASGLLFEADDAFVSNPVLYRGDAPYTGSFVLDGTRLTDGEGKSLRLNVGGMMLQNSSALTAWAFYVGFGKAGKAGNYIVTLSVFLFALSTIISWSYYGDRCVEYLFGIRYVRVYRIIYVFFTFLGAVLSLETVWTYGDVALGCMVVPNLIAVLLLSPRIAKMSRDYYSREHKRFK